jgi:hypothetical protein
MELSKTQRAKANPALQEQLRRSNASEVIRAIMRLDDDASRSSSESLHPSQFLSRVDYRRALINQKKAGFSDRTDTLEKLERLSLQPKGGKLLNTVVVEGKARDILRSLLLPEVASAFLDEEIRL